MSMFAKHMPAAPEFRALLNVGCLFDIQAGHYIKGKHGENILNGGIAPLTGLGGQGNTYKSTISHFFALTILDRYFRAEMNLLDTEMSAGGHRLKKLAAAMQYICDTDLVWHETANPTGRILITDSTVVSGNKWFDQLKEFAKAKIEAAKTYKLTTPFLSRDGSLFKAFVPSIGEVDSLSRLDVDATNAMLDKNSAGESGNNTEAMASAKAKHQMLIQCPELTASCGLYLLLTAHVDDSITIDAYAPQTKKLAFIKNGLKFKYVPNQFFFLMNNLWFCFGAARMVNQNTKAAEYPRDANDTDDLNTDLMKVTVQNLRGKYGPTGAPYEIIVSQSEGVQVSLTEFNYLKEYGRFGLGGHDRAYYLELCPEISMQRTTIRTKIREHAKLRRAFEITSEMCQMFNIWHDLDPELICTPKQLYEDLKAKGYDWDVLLNTRGYWVFEEDQHPLPFLSTMDLLEMRIGRYRPYWMK